MVSENNRYIIFYNGEAYNHLQLRKIFNYNWKVIQIQKHYWLVFKK